MIGIIKEALEYLTGLSKPELVEVDGYSFSDRNLKVVIHNPKAQAIKMSTLSSLVEYIKSNIDNNENRMIVHVVDPTTVRLYSALDFERERETVVEVTANIPVFPYEKYVDHERFCIAMQAKFLDDPESDRAKVLKFAGTVENGTVAQYADDGVSQKATVKMGVASKSDEIVPNPVKLRPYRTFHEVSQPISEFIFRMRSGNGVECALFEADGGAWKNVAMNNIKHHLEVELSELKNYIVIS